MGVQMILVTHSVQDVEALRALREVGRHGSIASAAAALGISQQALSARMRTLKFTAPAPTTSPASGWGSTMRGARSSVLSVAASVSAVGVASAAGASVGVSAAGYSAWKQRPPVAAFRYRARINTLDSPDPRGQPRDVWCAAHPRRPRR